MKKYFIIALTILFAYPLNHIQAQDEMKYLFGGGEDGVAVGGFGAIFNEFSGFDKDFAFSMGGGAALLIDHKFFIGAYGLGLTTQHLKDLKVFHICQGSVVTESWYLSWVDSSNRRP